MTYAKMSELTNGKNVLRISTPSRDEKIVETWKWFRYQVTHVSRKSLSEASHKIVVSVENFFLGLIMKLGKKFTSLGDIVRGKDIPRNRGAVSFFLKGTEEHKKSL
jgi:hypothetical protein